MASRKIADGILAFDLQATRHVRVRKWRHAGGPMPTWPAGAHDTVEVACVEAGAVDYRVGSQKIEATPGDAVLVSPEVEHKTTFAPATHATSVWLSRRLFENVVELSSTGRSSSTAALLLPRARDVVAVTRILSRKASRVRADTETEQQADVDAEIEALGDALLLRIMRHVGSNPTPVITDPRLRAAHQAIEQRFGEPLTVEELARIAGMSRYHFSRAFRAYFGESPYQMLIATRIERAAKLLRRPGPSVTETAFDVGFADMGRFARAFRQRMGCAPSAYRANHTAQLAAAG